MDDFVNKLNLTDVKELVDGILRLPWNKWIAGPREALKSVAFLKKLDGEFIFEFTRQDHHMQQFVFENSFLLKKITEEQVHLMLLTILLVERRLHFHV